MRSALCECIRPTCLTASRTFLMITSASWGGYRSRYRSERGFASRRQDEWQWRPSHLSACCCLTGAAIATYPANPPPLLWRRWHAVLLPWLQPLHLDQFSPLRHVSSVKMKTCVWGDVSFSCSLSERCYSTLWIANSVAFTHEGNDLMQAIDVLKAAV